MCYRGITFLVGFSLTFRYQFGFRSRRSTINALFKNIEKHQFGESIASCSSVFHDLKKAFDTTDHHVIIQKLDNIGIGGKEQLVSNDSF